MIFYYISFPSIGSIEEMGYDSAGVALISDNRQLNVYKAKGKVSEWACDFSIFRHKGNSARRICKGTFHSPGKKSPDNPIFTNQNKLFNR